MAHLHGGLEALKGLTLSPRCLLPQRIDAPPRVILHLAASHVDCVRLLLSALLGAQHVTVLSAGNATSTIVKIARQNGQKNADYGMGRVWASSRSLIELASTHTLLLPSP
jgi:hypothetical protein